MEMEHDAVTAQERQDVYERLVNYHGAVLLLMHW